MRKPWLSSTLTPENFCDELIFSGLIRETFNFPRMASLLSTPSGKPVSIIYGRNLSMAQPENKSPTSIPNKSAISTGRSMEVN